MTAPSLLRPDTTPEHPRSYILATVGDFATWKQKSRQAAFQHTQARWFPAKLGFVSEGQFPIWSARDAALAYLTRGHQLPALPREVDALVNGEPLVIPALCGVGEVARMTRISNSYASTLTMSDWFPRPYDFISAQSAVPVWDRSQVRAALVAEGHPLYEDEAGNPCEP